MEHIKITEEELTFSPEEMDRINKLREEREIHSYRNRPLKNKNGNELINDQPVYVRLKDTRFVGHIEKINKENNKISYDVRTPHGLLRGLSAYEVYPRKIDNELKDVIVPEELAKLNAPHLLSLLRSTYKDGYGYNEDGELIHNPRAFHEGKYYTAKQIKAALIDKPHVPNKREAKRVRELKKSKNKR